MIKEIEELICLAKRLNEIEDWHTSPLTFKYDKEDIKALANTLKNLQDMLNIYALDRIQKK